MVFRERTLLERLASPRAAQARTMQEDVREQPRSVQRHLSKLLNSRHGHALAQPDHGLPAPEDLVHAMPGAVPEMLRSVRACLEKYEPRLGAVEVVHIESEDQALALRIRIHAQLVTGTRRVPVMFDTTIDGSGRIQVRG